MDKIKFLAFADLHHYPGVFKNDASERLKIIQQAAAQNSVDFIIELGDFCHIPTQEREIIDQFNDFEIPGYHTLGNHDTDGTSLKKTLELYRMPNNFYHFDRKGFRFIVLDTNYFKDGDKYVHYEHQNYFDFPDTREYVSPDQFEWLENIVSESPYPCILFSHASLERDAKGIPNIAEFKKVLSKVNKDKRKIILCINGHYHRDYLRILDQVAYLDLNSVSYDWVQNPHNFFPEEVNKKYKLAANTIIYNDPLYAIIGLASDGTLTIEGIESTMYKGVTREMTDNSPCDPDGRPATPKVLSAKIKLF